MSKQFKVKKNSTVALLAALALVSVTGVAGAQDGVTTFVDPANKNIQIGNGTKFENNNGKNGAIAIGDGAHVNDYVMQQGSIALGTNAKVENMYGTQEKTFNFGQTDATQWAAGIAIGQNTYARSGSVMIGDHKYVGALGDVTVDASSNAGVNAKSLYINSTTLGANAYTSGSFATVNGSYSIATSDYQGLGGFAGIFDGPKAAKNFGANIYGSLNSIESASSSSNYAGIASSVIGTANRTANSNGALIFGAGNEITNSITNISAPSSGGASAKALQTTLMTSIRNSQSGGATLAIGGGNKADYTQKTSIIGVNNTVTGTSSDISQYNSVNGFNNTLKNVDNSTVIGTNRTLENVDNSIVIGSADSGITSTASDEVAIGRNTNVANDGGVALGSGSVSAIDKGVIGYDPAGKITDADSIGAVVGQEQYDTLKAAVTSGTETVNTLTSEIAAMKEEQSTLSQWSSRYFELQEQIDAKQTELDTAETTLASDQLEYNKLVSTWESTGAAVSVGNSETGLTRQITNVAAGSADTDAVNVAQLKQIAQQASDQAKDVTLNFTGDDTKSPVSVKNGNALTIYGGVSAVDVSGNQMLTDEANLGVVKTDKGLQVKLAKDLQGLDSVRVGGNATNGEGIYIANQTATYTKDGAAGTTETGNYITGLSNKTWDPSNTGIVSGRAATEDQLNVVSNQVYNVQQDVTNINKTVNKLDNRVDRVGAGAAALAALHPLEFSPEAKWEVSAGVGNYKGANAVALGAFYRPNGDTMVSVGTSYGGGENMVNAGVTLRIGDGETQKYPSKKVMAQKINDLESVVADQNNKIEELTKLVNTLINNK